jgi:hypothetical protein
MLIPPHNSQRGHTLAAWRGPEAMALLGTGLHPAPRLFSEPGDAPAKAWPQSHDSATTALFVHLSRLHRAAAAAIVLFGPSVVRRLQWRTALRRSLTGEQAA